MNIRTCPQSLRCKLVCEVTLQFTHKLNSISDSVKGSGNKRRTLAALTRRGISGLMRFLIEAERNENVDVQYSLCHRCYECLLREEATASDVRPQSMRLRAEDNPPPRY